MCVEEKNMQVNSRLNFGNYRANKPVKADNNSILKQNNTSNVIKIDNIPLGIIRANSCPISFTGNAEKIKEAFIITDKEKETPLLITKDNASYVIDFDSQTEIIYGVDAKKYLDGRSEFEYDTQVVFPKKSSGILQTKGKSIPLPENSAVILKAGTKDAVIKVDSGYPMLVLSKKDYNWYERYSRNANDENIRNKFLELMYYNSHMCNAEFSPNVLLPEYLTEQDFLASVGIDKYKSRNRLVFDLYERKDMLSDDDKQKVEFAKELVDSLYQKGIVTTYGDDYCRFVHLYNDDFERKYLEDQGLTKEEIEAIMPIFHKTRTARFDSKISLKNPADGYPPELLEKMKAKGLLHDNKKDADENIYWRHIYGNEQSLRQSLYELGFDKQEEDIIADNWSKNNRVGYDTSGLKYIDDDMAVYNLDDKLNNWTGEKTNWITNSTAISAKDGSAPFVGVSMVQHEQDEILPMSALRKGEKLHSHPNSEEKRQTEIYLITSGAAALNIVKEGKSQIKILKEGDLAVVGPDVMHSVNSISGEYEHIVTQVPSAFQYGLSFKQIVTPPQDFNEDILTQDAQGKLRKYKGLN